MEFEVIDRTKSAHAASVAAIWTAACGRDLAISQEAASYDLQPCAGASHAGILALVGGRPIGFVLTSHLGEEPEASPPEMGWVDAIAVLPEAQRQGVGNVLLDWAETWLQDQGCKYWTIGGSIRTFAPGVPAKLGSEGFFLGRGFLSPPDYSRVWDVARDLQDYDTPSTARRGQGFGVRQAEEADAPLLHEFLKREFPGRWRYEFEEFWRGGERLSDYTLLWTDSGIEGFCLLTFEDSVRPMDRFFPWSLPRPWGQLGTVGVSRTRRGQGLGAVLMDGALQRLRAAGVRGCVIDWTTIVDFYGKFGFTPYREYIILARKPVP